MIAREIWYFYTLPQIKAIWNIIYCFVRTVIIVDLWKFQVQPDYRRTLAYTIISFNSNEIIQLLVINLIS